MVKRRLSTETAKATGVVRAAIYARVSTREQTNALQLDEANRFCRARGWQVVSSIQDHVSGVRDRRPGLDRLLAMVRGRHVDCVVVWKRDRLFRSLQHLISCCAEFEALGVDFVSVTEQIDTTTPTGKLILRVLGSLAEFERDLLIERTKAGMAAAERRGAKIGRPRRRFDLERAEELLAGGASQRNVARLLSVGLGTLQRALANGGEK